MDAKLYAPPGRVLRPGIGGSCVAGVSAVGIGALLLPQSSFRNAVAMPAMLWIAYTLRKYTSGPVEEDYLMAVNVTMALAKFIDFSILRIPEQECCRIRSDGTVETPQEIANMTLWQKFGWSVDLSTTQRGIGWNWQVKNIQEVPKSVSRSPFVLDNLVRFAYCFVYLDIYEWYMINRSPFAGPGLRPSLFDLPLGEQLLYAWTGAIHSGATIAIGYNLLAAIAVGSGLSPPQRWPAPFGSFFRKGYTIRNCWGSCWHQFLRRTFETANAALTKVLGVKKGTLTSRYLQIYNAFFVSAVIHHIGTYNSTFMPTAWYQFYWFMIQPVAITFEDFAIYLGKRAKINESCKLIVSFTGGADEIAGKTRAIGYAWVGAFLSYGLRYPIAMFFDYGLATVRYPLVAQFSIMERVFG